MIERGSLNVRNGGTGSTDIQSAHLNLHFGKVSYLDFISGANMLGEPIGIAYGGTAASSVMEALNNLGVGEVGLKDVVNNVLWDPSDPLAVINGGTGASTLDQAWTNLGLFSCDFIERLQIALEATCPP